MTKPKILTILSLVFLLANCAGVDIERHNTDVKAEKDASHGRSVETPDTGSFLDDLIGDFNLPGSGGTAFGFGGSITFGAALDKTNFMPLASVDSDSGIMIFVLTTSAKTQEL